MKSPEEIAKEILSNTDGHCNDSGTCFDDIDLIANISEAIRTERTRTEEREKITGETSDGYHTFNELYDHRVLLWINLCLFYPYTCYVVEEHYAGWFLLGMETLYGQISYHCPNKYLYLVWKIARREVKFDGHSSKDVVSRLEKLAVESPTPDSRDELILKMREALEAISKDGYWNYPVKESGVSHDKEWMPTSPALIAKKALAMPLPASTKRLESDWKIIEGLRRIKDEFDHSIRTQKFGNIKISDRFALSLSVIFDDLDAGGGG